MTNKDLLYILHSSITGETTLCEFIEEEADGSKTYKEIFGKYDFIQIDEVNKFRWRVVFSISNPQDRRAGVDPLCHEARLGAGTGSPRAH